MSFADKCPHCEHYQEGLPCCFCEKDPNALKKTREQHLAEIEGDDDEIDID